MRFRNPVAAMLGALALAGCSRTPDPVLQHLRKVDAWVAEFERQYPGPMAGAEKPPLLGRMGEIGPSRSLSFLLADYPYDEMPALEKWLRGKMAADGIAEVRLDCLFPMKGTLLKKKQSELTLPDGMPAERREKFAQEWSRSMEGFVEGRRIVLSIDGTRQETERSPPPSPTFHGKPIHPRTTPP